jgi:hypothetical protein
LPQSSEEGTDIRRQELWLFDRGEVASSGHLSPALHVIAPLDPFPWRETNLLWKMSNAAGNMNVIVSG